MLRRLAAFLFALFVVSAVITAFAQQQPSGRVVIRAGKLLDVRSGKTLTDQAIVIEGDKIISVGAAADAKTSASDKMIDLRNATVVPGLIDAHTHLTMDPKDSGYESLGISVPGKH